MRLRKFQEKASEFQEKARAGMVAFHRKRNGKNVSQFGRLGIITTPLFSRSERTFAALKKPQHCRPSGLTSVHLVRPVQR